MMPMWAGFTLANVRATYGQRAGTFLSNAAVLQVFGVNDHDSSRLICDLLGQEAPRVLDYERGIRRCRSGHNPQPA